MTINIYNTISRKKEEFVPINKKQVAMYVCGITPYDDVHLGHARVYVAFDIIRRYLELSGYDVKYIQNFTDVDDKIISRADKLGISPRNLSEMFISSYFEQMDKLNIKRASLYPKVTENIPQIIDFVSTLIKNENAYILDGDVYFSVRKFDGYGKLSGRSLDDLQSGARVVINEQKKDPLDFALWKKTKSGEPADASWESPWGMGRPGWHIECSVMSTNYLGPTIDIHGGGQDLIFPHHENELAQSEAATGQSFVKYWIHNGFVTLNREKMSKSLGNFFTLKDIFEKYHPRVVRYFLLSQHYRSPLDFSDDKLVSAQAALNGIDEAYQKLSVVPFPEEHPARLANLEPEILPEIISAFKSALDDDFNTEKALAVLHEFKRDILSTIDQKSPVLLHRAFLTLKILMQDYLGIPFPEKEKIPPEVLAVREEREKARNDKDWAMADTLRGKLDSMGYKVEDKPNGISIIIRKSI